MTASNPATGDALLRALATHPDTTAAELAGQAGCGRSTATKALALLAADGKVTRQAGGRDPGGRRQPDRWRLAQAPPAPPADAPTARAGAVAAEEPPAPSPSQPARPDPSPPDPSPPDPAGNGQAAAVEQSRLRHGELRAQVLGFLAGRPGEELTPGAVAKGLGGRSAGAVGNALATLTSLGEVLQTSRKPRRYTYLPEPAHTDTATATATAR